jgi:hypothetical protein
MKLAWKMLVIVCLIAAGRRILLVEEPARRETDRGDSR